MDLNTKTILEQGHKAYSYARSAAFSGEYQLLHGFTSLFKSFGELPKAYNDPHLRSFLLEDIDSLFKKDGRLFCNGICPWSLLAPELPFSHMKRLSQIMVAGVKMSRLRKLRKTKVEENIQQDLPDYYRRNYHWQLDGYLSDSSAKLYDHQVEILFKGTGAAMRRLIMPSLHDFLGQAQTPQKILEVGAGTGHAAVEVHQSFSKHELTVTELSSHYLAQARKKLKTSRVDFVRAKAEELPFKENQFDVIYSTFLFHELPREVREKALVEFKRVLRPGGLLVIVDSIQAGEVSQYEKLLENFPRDYHEPFYKDYSNWPLEKAFEVLGVEKINSERGFLSKCVSGIMPS